MALTPPAAVEAFLSAATWHGTLEYADQILAQYPAIRDSIHVAAVIGDDDAVKRFITADPASATAKAPPYDADALNYLGLSKYLRFDQGRTPAFVRAATALLDAGADPNTGFWTTGDHPEFETALYGAAGVAHNEAVTRLLLERGADPNDGEAVYHSPESNDLGSLKALVESGKLTPGSLSMMLIRKIDWHDHEGARYLLEQGKADANHQRDRGWHALHHALVRDNRLPTIELLLQHGADPAVAVDGLTGVARAAHLGRSDVLELLAKRGHDIALTGVDRLIAACCMGDSAPAIALAQREPASLAELLAIGGHLLGRFSGTCNTPGVRALLDVGVDVAAPFAAGDGYFGIPENALAIHVAAWRAGPSAVKLLIERGAPVNAVAPDGATPLALAVKACVDSYWTDMRSPDSVRALLEAGASVQGVPYPSGYREVDDLLKSHGA